MLPSKLYVRGAVINLLEEQLFCMSMCNMCSMFTVYNWIYVQWSISAIYDRLLLAKRKQCGRKSRAAWWCHTMRWQDYITTAKQVFKCKFSVWRSTVIHQIKKNWFLYGVDSSGLRDVSSYRGRRVQLYQISRLWRLSSSSTAREELMSN